MTKEERTGVAAEYKDILEALIEANSRLSYIDNHLVKLNSKTSTHGEGIDALDKWVAVHDAVGKVVDGIEKTQVQLRNERIKNSIAIWGLLIMAALNLYVILLK